MRIKRILVPTDFSDASLAAVDYAVELAKPFKATLLIVLAVEPLYYAGDLGLQLEEQRRLGREDLDELAARLKRAGVECQTILETGTPYRVIADLADRQAVDLIVMATHGRGGLSHLLIGSVTEKVVRTANRPVLTVHPAARGLRSIQSVGRRSRRR